LGYRTPGSRLSSSRSYGTGFPLCSTCDKPIVDGLGTALKPAHEPIVVARKSTVGTVAGNVAEHGTGALNIDACRVGDDTSRGDRYNGKPPSPTGSSGGQSSLGVFGPRPDNWAVQPGRWPTNVVLDESQAEALDAQTGVLTSGGGDRRSNARHVLENRLDRDNDTPRIHDADSGGASRFFPTFRYEAKAPTYERPSVDDVLHPTVKPLDLMRWLVRLVTPPGGLVLDPFLGSGTTAEACILENLHCIGIEREPDYLPLIVQRISKPLAVGFDFGEAAG
jgi:site-specific DNA-methyltransferase (adenine-specific)